MAPLAPLGYVPVPNAQKGNAWIKKLVLYKSCLFECRTSKFQFWLLYFNAGIFDFYDPPYPGYSTYPAGERLLQGLN